MNLIADEGVDRQIVEQLRHEGHDVVYVAELAPSRSAAGTLPVPVATLFFGG